MEKQEFSPKAHHFLRSVNAFNKPLVLWHLYRQKSDIFHFNIGPGSLACRRNDVGFVNISGLNQKISMQHCHSFGSSVI